MAGMNFCPVCGLSVSNQPYSFFPSSPPSPQSSFYTPYPIIGGILILIASVVILIDSIVSFIDLVWYPNREFFTEPISIILYSVIKVWGFALGMGGGYFALRRRKYTFALLGAIFVLTSGVLGFYPFYGFGFFILPPAFIGLIFIWISKKEFDVVYTPISMSVLPPKSDAKEVPESVQVKPTIGTLLRELNDLQTEGLITIEEYNVKKEELLSKL
jgi:hypothetical protein